MNHLWNLVRKELRELLTPSSLISIIVVVVLLSSLGTFMGSEIKGQMSIQPVGYYDQTGDGDDGYATYSINELKNYYKEYGMEPDEYIIDLSQYIKDDSPVEDQLLDAMKSAGVESSLVFSKDFNDNIKKLERGTIDVYWIQTNTSVFSSLNTVIAGETVARLNDYIGNRLVSEDPSLDKNEIDIIKAPSLMTGSTFFNGTLQKGVTPDQIYSALGNQTMLVPIIIMLVIVMIGSIVISSIGNEKENKTMETLLTLPINRTTIVSGKLIGASISGLIMGALYMVGMYFYINGVMITTGDGVSLESLGLTLDVLDWIMVIATMFLAIICALGMCMILGAFAKNYKAAQTYVLPISVLALIPMFITMFGSYGELPMILQVLLFIIPFTHPMVVMQNLMFGNMAMVFGGLAYLLVFAFAMIYVTVRLYKSDILLTGIILKKKNKAE